MVPAKPEEETGLDSANKSQLYIIRQGHHFLQWSQASSLVMAFSSRFIIFCLLVMNSKEVVNCNSIMSLLVLELIRFHAPILRNHAGVAPPTPNRSTIVHNATDRKSVV